MKEVNQTSASDSILTMIDEFINTVIVSDAMIFNVQFPTTVIRAFGPKEKLPALTEQGILSFAHYHTSIQSKHLPSSI